ncbi:MAG: lyase family protein [Bacteroidota bacterium]|nr:lyase family protein [Bacteroidota bacterium]
MRKEKDFLGTKDLSEKALYGIHSLRACENFPDNTPFATEWYRAVGWVKKACYLTYADFKKASIEKYPEKARKMDLFDDEIIDALIDAAGEVAEGKYSDQFIVPGISGGAGTSINMNINEIIANVALIRLGHEPGDYKWIDPIVHANIFQSTNDVIPTSLKVALMKMFNELEKAVNELRAKVEEKENKHRNDLRIGYTQMQEAVPTSFGKLFGSYSEALSRDWWRISKCFERIKLVNLGGSAVGTGIAVPRFFIMQVVPNLRNITGLALARSENLPDATSNLDSFVEVHAILKAHAVNLEKMVSDLRLLGSDLLGNKEVEIPQKQVGSSIMPGKINPVIPEFVISATHRVYANDILVSNLCGMGCLELNAYLPLIGHAMLESIRLLISCDKTLKDNLIQELVVHSETSNDKLFRSPSITTALVPHIGYHKASELARIMKTRKCNVFEANQEMKLLTEEDIREFLRPDNLLKLGYQLNDLPD